MKDIIIIGSSHISRDSAREVKKIIEEVKPEFVALELDKQRIQALLSGKEQNPSIRMIKHIGFGGYLFLKIGKFVEKKLGNIVGTKPGIEMKQAIKTAKENNSKIALIDQNINITLRKLSKEFKIKQILKDVFKGIFKKRKLLFDIRKVPSEEIIEKYMLEIKNNYPGVYKVIIEERNQYMANQLFNLKQYFPDAKIVAVVGAGHKKGMIKILEDKFKTYLY